jgi:hypothetical protein
MYTGRTLFSQVMDFVPWTSFHRIVAKYRGDIGVRTLRCTEHFRIMAFAQITYRESLRDIEACLGAQPAKLCSMGLRDPVARSTLADANELRDWRLWSDLAAVLIKRARKLYLKDDFGLDLANTVYALDSTTIDLCLSLFPWADFRSTKAAVKMHTLLDLRGPIPSLIIFPTAKWAMPWLSISSRQSPGPSTSWIAAMSISGDFMRFIKREPSLLLAQKST